MALQGLLEEASPPAGARAPGRAWTPGEAPPPAGAPASPRPQQQAGLRLLIVMGKGGTGKTTVAGALAVALARRGQKVLAVSVDPAHNLGDVLATHLGPEPQQITGAAPLRPPGGARAGGHVRDARWQPGLWALEMDVRREMDRYLEQLAGSVRGAYRYLEVLNLGRYLETLRFSPGVEEQAVLEAIGRLRSLAERDSFDVLILDTPPTGQAMRLLSLPAVSVQWAEQLAQVRRALLERRAAIARAVGPEEATLGGEGGVRLQLPTDPRHDEVMGILLDYSARSGALQQWMRDPALCGVVMVRNPDRLSGLETGRALQDLAAFGIPVALGVLNRMGRPLDAESEAARGGQDLIRLFISGFEARVPGSDPEPLDLPFPVRAVPLRDPEPSGVEALAEVSRSLVD